MENWVKSGKIYQNWTDITPGPNNSTPKRIANQSAHGLHQKKKAEQPTQDTQLWVTTDSYVEKHMAGRMGRPPLAAQPVTWELRREAKEGGQTLNNTSCEAPFLLT